MKKLPDVQYSYIKDFPIHVMYNSTNLRILITAGTIHNSLWLHDIKEKDVLFIQIPCYMPDNFIGLEIDTLRSHGFPLDKFYFLCNTKENLESYQKRGINSYLIHHNIGLDSTIFKPNTNPIKIYDAIYNARPIMKKRHFLAEEVDNLALIVGFPIEHQSNVSTYKVDYDKLKTAYKNIIRLTPNEVNEKYQQSYCGLMLSESEGGCFASSEYLLSGIPVVSTKSQGGRDIFYNKNNSIVCEPTRSDIKNAVIKIKDMVKSNMINPEVIRSEHLVLSHRMLQEFRDVISSIGTNYGESIDISKVNYPNIPYVTKTQLYDILNEVK